MTNPVRIGVVGGGSHSAVGATHLAAARLRGDFAIVGGLFSRDEERNRLSHEAYRLPWRGHAASIEDWLDAQAGALDLVVLLTPSTDHAAQLGAIAERGLDFLVEKPVACTSAEAADLRARLDARPGLYARCVHNYSGYPLFREMALRVAEGRIGPVHHVRVEMPSDGFAREAIVGRPQAWRQRDPEIPMLMLDLGTHMHHLAAQLVGVAPGRVAARTHRMVNSFGVIDNAEIWHEREDGVRVTYWMSKAHLGVKNGLAVEAYGSKGSLRWRQMDPDHLVEADLSSNETIVNRGAVRPEANRRAVFKPGHPTGYVDAFAAFYSDLADDWRARAQGEKGNRWICGIDDAFAAVRFLAAAARAARETAWVDLP